MPCVNCGNLCERNSLNCEHCLQKLLYDKPEQELERELELFVGKHYPRYKRKWELEQTRQFRWSWNGYAAFFGVLWLGYRRQYRLAFLILLVYVTVNAICYYSGWNYSIPLVNEMPAALLVLLSTSILLGFFANQLYYEHALRVIYKIKAKGIADQSVESYLLKTSGETKRTVIIGFLAVSIALSLYSHRLFPTDTDIVNVVRKGSLYDYPLYSIGESFEQYFQAPVWYYNRAPDGLELVEFHGYQVQEGKESQQVVIQFLVDYHLKEIEPYSLEVNGAVQDEAAFYELMDAVYSVQNPFELNDDLDSGSEKSAL